MKVYHLQNLLLVCTVFMLSQRKLVSAEDIEPSKFSKDDFQKYLQENELIVIKYYATWCQPCMESEGPYKEAAGLISKTNPKVKVIKIDVDQNPDVTSLEQVNQLPTLIFYKSGKKADQYGGDMKSSEEIANWAAKLIDS